MAEWAVGVKWLKAYPREEACTFKGIFANPNVVCKLRDPKTTEFLRNQFGIQVAWQSSTRIKAKGNRQKTRKKRQPTRQFPTAWGASPTRLAVLLSASEPAPSKFPDRCRAVAQDPVPYRRQ
jgi:hypothetical protein